MNRRGFLKAALALPAAPLIPALPVAAAAVHEWYCVGGSGLYESLKNATFEEVPLQTIFKGEIGRYENIRFIMPND